MGRPRKIRQVNHAEHENRAEHVAPAEAAQVGGLVRVWRGSPAYPGGPIEADIHPEQMAEWLAAGWRHE